MSRSYSNFLIFEDVLDLAPINVPVVSQAINTLLNPIVKIVEQDCNTLVGERKEASFDMEGFVEIATGAPLTYTRIEELVAGGNYVFGIRNMATCMSYRLGGVCQRCYEASFIGQTAPIVGTTLTIPSSQVYQTDLIRGDGAKSKFSLTQTSDDYYSVKVINNGQVVPESAYTLGYDYIQFPYPLPNIAHIGIYTVHFLKHNTEPFQGLISKTYSGGLLGMQPLPTLRTIIRPSLYEDQFSDNFINMLLDNLKTLRIVPSTYLQYVENIHSRLERVVMIVYLYAMYSSINTA